MPVPCITDPTDGTEHAGAGGARGRAREPAHRLHPSLDAHANVSNVERRPAGPGALQTAPFRSPPGHQRHQRRLVNTFSFSGFLVFI